MISFPNAQPEISFGLIASHRQMLPRVFVRRTPRLDTALPCINPDC
jgi:hypothetical protein